MSLDKASILKSAFGAADAASEILVNYFGRLKNVEEKFQAGLVSEADRESELKIKSLIQAEYPSHSFLGEETGLTEGLDSVSNWVIDPLDGTTNYVHQFPYFAISIGFEHEGVVQVGVVDAPLLNLRYHAVRGKGAFVNGKPIRTSTRTKWSDALFATGFPAVTVNLNQQFALIQKTLEQARGVRRAGAASLDLCFVAQGSFDCYWEENLAPWDTAAGFLIAHEAGASVTDFAGADYHPRLKSVVAGTPAIHKQFLEVAQGLGYGLA